MGRVDEALDLLYEDEELAFCCDDVLPSVEELLLRLDSILPDWADSSYFVELVGKIRKELLANPKFKENLLEGKMGVITVTFELGSAGLEVARGIADRLGYRLIYSEVLSDVASRLGVPERKIEEFDEFKYVPSKLSFFDFFQLDKEFVDFGAIFGEKKKEITFEEFREALMKSITAFAVSNNVIIVGHGAACILKEYPNTLHLKVEAPFYDRVKVYAEKEGLSLDEAEKRLEKIDNKEREFYKDVCSEDVSAINLYHLKFNTSRLPVEACVDLAIKAFDLVVKE